MFTLHKENKVNTEIPDRGSVVNTIEINRKGMINDITVDLNIEHPFIGDIVAKLTSPKGTEVFLHNRQGGSSDDFNGTISGDTLAPFKGESVKGVWTLTVEDRAPRDSGSLVSWAMNLTCEEFDSYNDEVFIPAGADHPTMTSTQYCRLAGRILSAELDYEIEHPLVGDLVATLVSPSGKEIIVHDRMGGSQSHIKRTVSSDHLTALEGETCHGNWHLKVQNFHSSERGVLTHWKIKFRYQKVDDLKKIEGIGPKIEGLLNAANIYSFATLSVTPAEMIKGVLNAAGDRYKMHDPTTWGRQATLAATGKWEELKVLQDVLDGGKEVGA